jgi:hypothetical protein
VTVGNVASYFPAQNSLQPEMAIGRPLAWRREGGKEV